MRRLDVVHALGCGPVAFVVLELQKAATASFDARVGVSLLGLGMVVGFAAQKIAGQTGLRVAGGGVALAGLYLLAVA